MAAQGQKQQTSSSSSIETVFGLELFAHSLLTGQLHHYWTLTNESSGDEDRPLEMMSISCMNPSIPREATCRDDRKVSFPLENGPAPSNPPPQPQPQEERGAQRSPHALSEEKAGSEHEADYVIG